MLLPKDDRPHHTIATVAVARLVLHTGQDMAASQTGAILTASSVSGTFTSLLLVDDLMNTSVSGNATVAPMTDTGQQGTDRLQMNHMAMVSNPSNMS